MKSGQKFDINTGSENPFKSKLICEGVIVPNLKYLLRKNKLSEFETEEEKAEARKNLGIDDIVREVYVELSDRSRIHTGKFNSGNDCNDEGWYDYIVSGRPECSESDEFYILYTSPSGVLMCWSKRNSGKCYQRITKNHPWIAMTHDDYGLEHNSEVAIGNYQLSQTLSAYDLQAWVNDDGTTTSYTWDSTWKIKECWNKTHLHLGKQIYVNPGDIIRVRCFYRTGTDACVHGKKDEHEQVIVPEHLYDSDAYIYLSNSQSLGHDSSKLKSDYIKIKSLGALDYNWTIWDHGRWSGLPEDEHLDLDFARNKIFDNNLGWNYIKVNVPSSGNYYLHIDGDFTVANSWFAVDKVEVYSRAGGYEYYTDGGYNMNNCLNPGVYYNCTYGRSMPENHDDETYTVVVKSEWSSAENLYNVQQWAYSENYPSRAFYRLIKTPSLDYYDGVYEDWIQIDYEIDVPEKTYFEKVLDFEESGDESDLDFTIITEGQSTVGTITYNIHPVKLYKGLIVTGHYTTNPYSTNSIIGLLELYDESDSGEPVEVDVKDLAGDPDYGDLEGFLVLNTGIYLIYYGYDGYEQGNWIYLVYDTMESLQEKLKLAGKIDVVTTLPNENESLKLKTYYRLDEPISNLSVRLPIIDSTNLETIMLSFTTDSTFEWNIETSDNIKYSSDFELDANTEYELLILWTGIGWRVTKVSFDES